VITRADGRRLFFVVDRGDHYRDKVIVFATCPAGPFRRPSL
jgi:hypothetical protein